MNALEQALNKAFIESGMTPEEFYTHICNTRDILSSDADTLRFKVTVYENGDRVFGSNEWFGYQPSSTDEPRWYEL